MRVLIALSLLVVPGLVVKGREKVSGLLVIAVKTSGPVDAARVLRRASLKARAVLPEAEREITAVLRRSACGHVGVEEVLGAGWMARGPSTWALRE